MIFLDSWVWLEFVFGGDKADDAEAIIEHPDSADEGGLIIPTVITAVSYRIRTVENAVTTDDGSERSTTTSRVFQ
ncbi:hypothetical protein [Natrinema sp. HArc-T2]|uniref:hypothetical protein n=1 Tax=Natrinema sp. HArc-T2 TaxID=3242701 RepID=UPI00359CE0F2